MIKLMPEERANVAHYIHSICAITLDQSKDYLIEGRLNGLMQETGCTSFSQLVSRSKSEASGTLRRKIIDGITTGETFFFRDAAPFELLRHKILPEILDRRARCKTNQPIRIWSAACSTGQEFYSIAIVLRELLGSAGCSNVRILGTDISDQAVARASEGVFNSLEIDRGLPAGMRERLFVPHSNGWKVRDELRAMGTFRRLNLMEDFTALGKFDIVFCRNVAIYFNERDKISLFHRIEQQMERDGYLIIGSMESLGGICPQFESKRYLRSVYYQIRRQTDSGLAT